MVMSSVVPRTVGVGVAAIRLTHNSLEKLWSGEGFALRVLLSNPVAHVLVSMRLAVFSPTRVSKLSEPTKNYLIHGSRRSIQISDWICDPLMYLMID